MICVLRWAPTPPNQVLLHHHLCGPVYPVLPATPFPLATSIRSSVSLSSSLKCQTRVKSPGFLAFPARLRFARRHARSKPLHAAHMAGFCLVSGMRSIPLAYVHLPTQSPLRGHSGRLHGLSRPREERGNEHRGAQISVNTCFRAFWVDTQGRDCWVTW